MMDLAQAQARVKFKTKPSSMMSGLDGLEYEDFLFSLMFHLHLGHVVAWGHPNQGWLMAWDQPWCMCFLIPYGIVELTLTFEPKQQASNIKDYNDSFERL